MVVALWQRGIFEFNGGRAKAARLGDGPVDNAFLDEYGRLIS
jgi:hypothetical protein